jgi:hypothetical protein
MHFDTSPLTIVVQATQRDTLQTETLLSVLRRFYVAARFLACTMLNLNFERDLFSE